MNTVVRGLERSRDWLDERGRVGWIAAMILGFILFWPIGLAILAYMIWSKRMFSRTACARRTFPGHGRSHWGGPRAWNSSGNTVFDAYKADTLRRLEEEQQAFESFLQRLREAKDKQEFDAFMEDRARAGRNQPPAPPAPPAAEPPQGSGAY